MALNPHSHTHLEETHGGEMLYNTHTYTLTMNTGSFPSTFRGQQDDSDVVLNYGAQR